MHRYSRSRRRFLISMGALGAGMTGCAQTGSNSGRSGTSIAYDPAAKFELDVTEVEYRRTRKGRQLMARIYRPQGMGPFPVVLDLHGGAWNNKDRFAEQPMDRAIAASGVLVVAIDLTLAPEAPYPASVRDANSSALSSSRAAESGTTSNRSPSSSKYSTRRR